MNTIEIILAVAIFLVLLGTWDNSGRIDKLQRQAAKPKSAAEDKNLLGIISEMEAEIEAKDEEIKNLKAELNKVKFDYACEVAGGKAEEILKKTAAYLAGIDKLDIAGFDLLQEARKELKLPHLKK